MARKLGISPATAARRIRNMYTAGILTGSSVYVNPSLLGFKGGAYAMDVAEPVRKSEVIEKLKKINGMLFVHNFRGSLMGLFFIYEDENYLSKKIDFFLDASGGREGMLSRVSFPPCEATLSKEEWKLVARLSSGGFESYDHLASELGTSRRTLIRRLEKISGARAIVSSPTLDYKAIEGGVPADLIVAFAEGGTRREAENKILKLVEDYLVFFGYGESFVVYNLVLPKLTMSSEMMEKARAIDGVTLARAELVDQHIDFMKSLEAYVNRRVKIMGL